MLRLSTLRAPGTFRPRALLLAAAGLAGLASAACDGGGDAPLSGVLVTLDTTRQDALGCYGGDGATPHLDELARDAVLFTGARSVAPVTLPSHASMLTGLYPPRHTVRTNGLTPLPAAAVTLAERAKEAGFVTAAFLSAAVLDPPYGLAQGFDVYDTPRGTSNLSTAHMVERPDAEVARAAAQWLRGRDRDRPFFLWVHLFDPHAPYAPAAAFRKPGPNPRADYLGEVAGMDHAFGEFMDALEEEHGLDHTFLMVVGDHGEALGAHGEETHTILVYEELLAVPLLVRRPDEPAPGTRVSRLASVADVFPTMLEGLGLPTPGNVDGQDLFTEPANANRGVYFESFDGYLNYGWSPLAGWMDANGKYVHGTSPELFDLTTDAHELTNLFADEKQTAVYRDALAALDAAPALARGSEDVVDETHRTDLQALGYTASGAGATRMPRLLENTHLPDPRLRLDELAAFHAAVLEYNEAVGRKDTAGIEDAIRRMTVIADQNPHNSYANGALGSFLYRQGSAVDAVRRLRGMPDERRDRANVQDTLGHSLEFLKSPDQALPCFQRALELKPGDPHQLQDVIRVLTSLGRAAEAQPLLELLNRNS